jgi:hypothetical protein
VVAPDLMAPTVRINEDAVPRLVVSVTTIKQHVHAEAFGSPSEARRLGAEAVDENAGALRRLG